MQQSIFIKEGTGISYVIISLIVYFSYLMLPIVRAYLPQSARYIVYLIVLSGAIGGSLYFEFEEWQKIIIFLFVITIFTLLNYFGKWNGKISPSSYFLENFLFWAGFFYLLNFKNIIPSDLAILVNLFSIFTLITLTTTIVGNILYPNASRFLATNINTNISYSRLNIGGYDFIYGLVILFPFFISFFRVLKGIRRTVALTLIMLTLSACFFTEYTTAIIICMIILLIELLSNIKNRALFWVSLIVVIIIFFVLRNPFSNFLLSIKDFCKSFGLVSIAERIDNIRNVILGRTVSGDAALRSSSYARSFRSFLNNPIIGCIGEEPNLGGHSEILDTLGGTGLIGFTFFAVLLNQHYRNITSYIGSELFWPCIESFFAFLGVASVNTVLSSAFIGACLILGPFIANSISIEQPVESKPLNICKYIR